MSAPFIWFLIGVFFIAAELAMPAFMLIFFAAGSFFVALMLLLLTLSITEQVVVFVVFSLALLVALRKYFRRVFLGKTQNNSEDAYAEDKIGKQAVVTKALSPGVTGEIKMAGSFWRATSESHISEGQSVVVDNHEPGSALTFKVRPVNQEKQE